MAPYRMPSEERDDLPQASPWRHFIDQDIRLLVQTIPESLEEPLHRFLTLKRNATNRREKRRADRRAELLRQAAAAPAGADGRRPAVDEVAIDNQINAELAAAEQAALAAGEQAAPAPAAPAPAAAVVGRNNIVIEIDDAAAQRNNNNANNAIEIGDDNDGAAQPVAPVNNEAAQSVAAVNNDAAQPVAAVNDAAHPMEIQDDASQSEDASVADANADNADVDNNNAMDHDANADNGDVVMNDANEDANVAVPSTPVRAHRAQSVPVATPAQDLDNAIRASPSRLVATPAQVRAGLAAARLGVGELNIRRPPSDAVTFDLISKGLAVSNWTPAHIVDQVNALLEGWRAQAQHDGPRAIDEAALFTWLWKRSEGRSNLGKILDYVLEYKLALKTESVTDRLLMDDFYLQILESQGPPTAAIDREVARLQRMASNGRKARHAVQAFGLGILVLWPHDDISLRRIASSSVASLVEVLQRADNEQNLGIGDMCRVVGRLLEQLVDGTLTEELAAAHVSQLRTMGPGQAQGRIVEADATPALLRPATPDMGSFEAALREAGGGPEDSPTGRRGVVTRASARRRGGG